MEKKVCATCNQDKKIIDYSFDRRSKTYSSTCKNCYRLKDKQKRDELKKEKEMYGYF